MSINSAIQASLDKAGLGAAKHISLHASSLFSVYRVETANGHFAAKIMEDTAMATAESAGLQAIRQTGARAPQPFAVHNHNGCAVLLMEFVESGGRCKSEYLLRSLVQLYSHRNSSYGFQSDNYIGTLKQSNRFETDLSDFLLNDRLFPQIDMAARRGLLSEGLKLEITRMVKDRIAEWGLQADAPRLIHGDLWSGNILSSRTQQAFLIDPSVSYSHPEQDLAMLDLFGNPLSHAQSMEVLRSVQVGDPEGYRDRTAFFQIYPLLVHVNIFGGAYVHQLESAVRRYL